MVLKAVGLGAGGHAKVVIDLLLAQGGVELVGLLDPFAIGSEVLGVPVIGDDSRLAILASAGVRHFFVAVGSTGDSSVRRRLYEFAIAQGLEAIIGVHPSAIVSKHVQLGAGTMVMAGAILNPGAAIGINCIINTGCIIEHDCIIGDHAHIAPGARLGGSVSVGAAAHIGIGATVLPGVQIGERAIVGAGSVILEDVPPDSVVVGVPGRVIRVKS